MQRYESVTILPVDCNEDRLNFAKSRLFEEVTKEYKIAGKVKNTEYHVNENGKLLYLTIVVYL